MRIYTPLNIIERISNNLFFAFFFTLIECFFHICEEKKFSNFLSLFWVNIPQVTLNLLTPVSSLYNVGGREKCSQTHKRTQILSIIYIYKMKSTMRISIFSSFIQYVAGLFTLKTKIESIATILLATDFDRVTNKIFVFDTKILKFWP
jgi:hypothetical protein